MEASPALSDIEKYRTQFIADAIRARGVNMDKIFAFVLTVLGTVCVIWLVRNGLIGLLNVCK
jgi:hypothetical protein